ncbi:MAG: alpha/beta fold hydrolase, partial [Myxococcales bacterium]|nr:alpha/beta fold hydrolase [Myxococcales bacterium]
MSRAGLPVVLIHGALRSRAGLLPTALALRRRGFDARPFGYATRRATLEQHGERLADFVAEWQRARGDERWPVLGVMTHSMGGLVARAYLALARAGAQSEAQRVVMLAPPNQGAFVAAQMHGWRPFHWMYGRAADELQPGRV